MSPADEVIKEMRHRFAKLQSTYTQHHEVDAHSSNILYDVFSESEALDTTFVSTFFLTRVSNGNYGRYDSIVLDDVF